MNKQQINEALNKVFQQKNTHHYMRNQSSRQLHVQI